MSFQKNIKVMFFKSEKKRKIRILEHWQQGMPTAA